MLSLRDVQHYISSVYTIESKENKLLLKLWEHTSMSAYKGQIVDFETFKKTYKLTNSIILVKGYCIDISDIGTIDECIKLLVHHRRSGQNG